LYQLSDTKVVAVDIALLASLAVVLLLVLAVLVGLGRRTDVVPRREWRLVQATRVLGVVAGGYAAFAVADPQESVLPDGWDRGYGAGQMLAPAAFGLVVLAFVAFGETVVRAPRPDGPRTASLRPRAVRQYRPRPTTVAVAAVTVVLGATLLFTTLTAGVDRSLGGHRVLVCAAGGLREARGPYPGSFYSVPLALAVAVVLAVAALAARQVVRRPRGLATTEHGDDVLRRRSVTVIVAAVGVATAFSQVGIGWVAGSALVELSDGCAPAWADPAGVVIGASAVVSLFVGLWCLVRIVSNDSLERPWS